MKSIAWQGDIVSVWMTEIPAVRQQVCVGIMAKPAELKGYFNVITSIRCNILVARQGPGIVPFVVHSVTHSLNSRNNLRCKTLLIV